MSDLTYEKKDIEQAMMDFCIRVLSGDGQPQEVAVLPQILSHLHELQQEKIAARDN